MMLRKIIVIVVIAGAAFIIHRFINDPHRTQLPIATTDLSRVEKQLARLTTEERALVEAYAIRTVQTQSVFPIGLTFADAIKSQRDWNIKHPKYTLLRSLVSASFVEAKIDENSKLVMVFKLENLGDDTIIGLRGYLIAFITESNTTLPLCKIDYSDSSKNSNDRAINIASSGNIEKQCEYNGKIEQLERDFAAHPAVGFHVFWDPTYVKFANGREIEDKSGYSSK